MEVSITQFRRELFELVGRAMAGDEVWVAHKGRRFRIAPEDGLRSRLSRITSLDVVDREAPDVTDSSWKQKMVEDWERDWSTL